jgi:hypothetical protein
MEQKDIRRGHYYVSLVKSIIRIGAAVSVFITPYGLNILAAGLIVAEILGIIEEL